MSPWQLVFCGGPEQPVCTAQPRIPRVPTLVEQSRVTEADFEYYLAQQIPTSWGLTVQPGDVRSWSFTDSNANGWMAGWFFLRLWYPLGVGRPFVFDGSQFLSLGLYADGVVPSLNDLDWVLLTGWCAYDHCNSSDPDNLGWSSDVLGVPRIGEPLGDPIDVATFDVWRHDNLNPLVSSINNDGVIIGRLGNGQTYELYLTPEPSGWLLFLGTALGCALVAVRRQGMRAPKTRPARIGRT
jgi:hypothetical protein